MMGNIRHGLIAQLSGAEPLWSWVVDYRRELALAKRFKDSLFQRGS
jgi:hypothetical protein